MICDVMSIFFIVLYYYSNILVVSSFELIIEYGIMLSYDTEKDMIIMKNDKQYMA